MPLVSLWGDLFHVNFKSEFLGIRSCSVRVDLKRQICRLFLDISGQSSCALFLKVYNKYGFSGCESAESRILEAGTFFIF